MVECVLHKFETTVRMADGFERKDWIYRDLAYLGATYEFLDKFILQSISFLIKRLAASWEENENLDLTTSIWV